MNPQTKLDQFRDDNPYDIETQAKRLLASEDKELILHVLALGLATAKQRQRHQERDYIKNVGEAPQCGRVVSGRTTGSIKIMPSKRMQNISRQLIIDVWRINGEIPLGDATANDLATAINRESKSAEGHAKNASFYTTIKEPLGSTEKVRERWNDKSIKPQIETIYGEFRKSEAA
jgi:hypothetical protein